jgi:hypothetical protein
MLALPKRHRLSAVPFHCLRERGNVIVREELAAMLDVTAEAVHEIEAITGQLSDPEDESKHSINSPPLRLEWFGIR